MARGKQRRGNDVAGGVAVQLQKESTAPHAPRCCLGRAGGRCSSQQRCNRWTRRRRGWSTCGTPSARQAHGTTASPPRVYSCVRRRRVGWCGMRWDGSSGRSRGVREATSVSAAGTTGTNLRTGMPKARARPKSASFSSPSRLMSRFCGLRSLRGGGGAGRTQSCAEHGARRPRGRGGSPPMQHAVLVAVGDATDELVKE